MRIGVVCEGPTDVHAIVSFLGASLAYRGFNPVFVTLQPESDRTKPTDGGWHAVLRRGDEIRSIVRIAGDFKHLSPNDLERHVPAPAVESTETWCVAAFRTLADDPERLRGQNLCQEFMAALHRSEGRTVQPFTHINKSPRRRGGFCKKHTTGFQRLEMQCRHYRELVESVERQASSR